MLSTLLVYQAHADGIKYASAVIETSNSPFSRFVKNPENALGNDPTTYASIVSPVLSALRSEHLRLEFPGSVPAGYTSGFMIGASSAIINLKVLPLISIITYDERNTKVQEVAISSDVLKSALLTSATQPTSISFVNSLPYSRIELHITFPALISMGSDLRIYSASAAPPIEPLPVHLVSFTGNVTTTGVSLKWQTASEENSSHFVVERCFDGAMFDSVGSVISAGNTSIKQQYAFVDEEIFNFGPSACYYRLRQVDLDGACEFSNTIYIDWRNQSLANKPSVYPSLVAGSQEITLKLSKVPDKVQNAYVYDLDGKMVRQVRLAAQITTLSSCGLVPGIYFIKVDLGNNIETVEFLVVN
ncbi:T9SS type A sorting domain-containing protein [Pontibacter aquaedesilientis]|nr:T9SS type A sorting domain-containing protein [Pontibacter aquaedesilientis]